MAKVDKKESMTFDQAQAYIASLLDDDTDVEEGNARFQSIGSASPMQHQSNPHTESSEVDLLRKRVEASGVASTLPPINLDTAGNSFGKKPKRANPLLKTNEDEPPAKKAAKQDEDMIPSSLRRSGRLNDFIGGFASPRPDKLANFAINDEEEDDGVRSRVVSTPSDGEPEYMDEGGSEDDEIKSEAEDEYDIGDGQVDEDAERAVAEAVGEEEEGGENFTRPAMPRPGHREAVDEEELLTRPIARYISPRADSSGSASASQLLASVPKAAASEDPAPRALNARVAALKGRAPEVTALRLPAARVQYSKASTLRVPTPKAPATKTAASTAARAGSAYNAFPVVNTKTLAQSLIQDWAAEEWGFDFSDEGGTTDAVTVAIETTLDKGYISKSLLNSLEAQELEIQKLKHFETKYKVAKQNIVKLKEKNAKLKDENEQLEGDLMFERSGYTYAYPQPTPVIVLEVYKMLREPLMLPT